MSETLSFCRRCKRRVKLVKVGQVATCPECGQEYEFYAGKQHAEPVPARSDQLLKEALTILLIIVVVILVGLAFLFAECASGLHNI